MTVFEDMAKEFSRAVKLGDDQAAQEIINSMREETHKLRGKTEFSDLHQHGEDMLRLASAGNVEAVMACATSMAGLAFNIDTNLDLWLNENGFIPGQSGFSAGFQYGTLAAEELGKKA